MTGRGPRRGARIGGRYQIGRIIGTGGMATVFASVDLKLERPVAVKIAARAGRDGVRAGRRLLDEARSMARVAHPAAVQLFDHGTDRRFGPFLVMELLEGEDLAAHIRRRGALPVNVARGIVEQLCGALIVAHRRHVLHHDLKPSNVFVLPDADGTVPRVKLLDFGAATMTDVAERRRLDGRLLGTLAYMAPERWDRAVKRGPRADVYGLGALLHEMLTGRPPFSGPTRAALRMSVMNDAPPPLPRGQTGVTPQLAAAIERALDKRPARRPADVRAFAAALGLRPGDKSAPPAEAAAPVMTPAGATKGGDAAVFVGREEALASLLDAVADVGRGRAGLVSVEGPSGIGKTALLEEVRRRLELRGDVIALWSRGLENDAVPFPALDEALEAIGAHVARLAPGARASILPGRAGPLDRLLPRLGALRAAARPPADRAPAVEPAAERRLAVDALVELVRRLSEQSPIVLFIDDAQWLDPDSAALLNRLFRGPDPPALLAIAALRTADDTADSAHRQLEAVLGRSVIARISVPALSKLETRAMARSRRGSQPPLDASSVQRLWRLSRGIPFFVEMLASDAAVPLRARARAGTTLDDVLTARWRRLPNEVRLTLELLCVSSRPLPLGPLLDALGDPTDRTPIDHLVARSLARVGRTPRGWTVEPFHARIREVIGAALSPRERRARHRRLVAILRGAGSEGDQAAIVEHLAGAGNARAAGKLARSAAQQAHRRLAFDRAAALLDLAQQHGAPTQRERQRLLRKQALALHSAGRRREAGEVLLRAAAASRDPRTAWTLRRAAGSQLLGSGDVTRGLAALAPALERADIHLPSDLAAIAAATGEALQGLAQRGLAPADDSARPSPRDLAKLDLFLELGRGLAHIDLRALPCTVEALRLALDVADRTRLQRACALFVINTVEYLPTPFAAPVLDLCAKLTDPTADPLAAALLDAAIAENAHFAGDFLEAEAAFERAERALIESGADASRELATVRDLAVFLQFAQKGDFRAQLERTQLWLAQAEATQDVFHAGMLRVAHAIVWIAQDDTPKARAELRRAQAESVGTAGVLEVAVALYYDIIDRYEGDEAALRSSGAARSALLRSPAAQTPFLSGYLGLQAAWRALRAFAQGDAGDHALVEVDAVVDRMRAARMGIWSAVADALDGNLAFLRGRREAALRALDASEQTFRRLHMLCLAACARKRRGQLVAGELGRRLETEADAELSALGVVNVERWTAAYWSMFDARAIAERTRDVDEDEIPEAATASGS